MRGRSGSCGLHLLRACDLRLEIRAELGEEAEHRPRCSVTERADRVARDAVRDAGEQLKVVGLAAAIGDAARDLLEPAGALAARRALATRLVGEELHDP